MSVKKLDRLFLGHRTFLGEGAEDLREILGDDVGSLPLPQRIFLQNEEATPVLGFPVLQSHSMSLLRRDLETFVSHAVEVEESIVRGGSTNMRAARSGWKEYRTRLHQALTNSVRSSFGRSYPSVFWLYHSIAVARILKEIPRRVREKNPRVGKTHGAAIKYRVFNRYLDRVLNETYEIVSAVAKELDEPEENLFPHVLGRMRDNVLLLTEDHISPDLKELDNYFQGCLNAEGPDFRHRFDQLGEWHAKSLEQDQELRNMIRGFLGIESFSNPWQLLTRPGYIRFLSSRPKYNPKKLLSPKQVDLWESLLARLKEFEVLSGLRRYVVPVTEKHGQLRCPAATLRGRHSTSREVTLSYTTRPMDFASPWVVDPVVQRFGFIYDITDFSSVVSMLRRSGLSDQDTSFRQIYGFQRQVDKLASAHRLKLEKYLGDGALYSGRHPTLLLAASVRLQRYYRRMLEEDFSFDRGLRIALNFGQYRLLPIQGAGNQRQYEFFGHGIVELSRLVSGKTTHEIDGMKALLVQHGYRREDVDRFFEPVVRRRARAGATQRHKEPFHAFINATGSLINEGIVATRSFMQQVADVELLRVKGIVEASSLRYLLCEIDDSDGTVQIGLVQLGSARLKGLGDVAIYEVRDFCDLENVAVEPFATDDLIASLEKLHQRIPEALRT